MIWKYKSYLFFKNISNLYLSKFKKIDIYLVSVLETKLHCIEFSYSKSGPIHNFGRGLSRYSINEMSQERFPFFLFFRNVFGVSNISFSTLFRLNPASISLFSSTVSTELMWFLFKTPNVRALLDCLDVSACGFEIISSVCCHWDSMTLCSRFAMSFLWI